MSENETADDVLRLREQWNRAKRLITAAYTGSAEHGGFLRGGGEMNPNPFLVIEDVERALRAIKSGPPQKEEYARGVSSSPAEGRVQPPQPEARQYPEIGKEYALNDPGAQEHDTYWRVIAVTIPDGVVTVRRGERYETWSRERFKTFFRELHDGAPVLAPQDAVTPTRPDWQSIAQRLHGAIFSLNTHPCFEAHKDVKDTIRDVMEALRVSVLGGGEPPPPASARKE